MKDEQQNGVVDAAHRGRFDGPGTLLTTALQPLSTSSSASQIPNIEMDIRSSPGGRVLTPLALPAALYSAHLSEGSGF